MSESPGDSLPSRAGQLPGGGTWMVLGGMLFRAVAQAALLVLVARALGPQAYAALASVVATSMIAAMIPMSCSTTLVKQVAINSNSLHVFWGSTLMGIGLAAIPLTVIAAFASTLLSPGGSALWAIAVLCITEIMLTPWCLASASVFQAMSEMGRYVTISLVAPVFRLLAGVLLAWPDMLSAQPTLSDWAVLYLMASALAGVASHWVACTALGKPRFTTLANANQILRDSIPFASGALAQSVQSSADKLIVTKICDGHTAGSYVLASRLIEFCSLPAWARSAALAPQLFQRLNDSTSSTPAELPSLAKFLLPAGILSGAALVMAPLIPIIFGEAYANTTTYAQPLAIIPVLVACRVRVQLILNTSGKQRSASFWLMAGAILVTLCGTILVNALTASGAIIALAIAETMMIFGMTYSLRSSKND